MNDFMKLRNQVNGHLDEFVKQDLDTRVHYLEEAILSPRFGATQLGTHWHWKLVSPDGSINPALWVDNSGDLRGDLVDIVINTSRDLELTCEREWWLLSDKDIWISAGEDVDIDAVDLSLDFTRAWIYGMTHIDKMSVEYDIQVHTSIAADRTISTGCSNQTGVYTGTGDPYHFPFTCVGDARIFDVDNLGSELHTDANAAAPSSDVDATTGWSAPNGGSLASVAGSMGFGSYMLQLTSDGGINNYAQYTFTTEVGKLYRLEVSIASPEYWYERDHLMLCSSFNLVYHYDFNTYDYVMTFYVVAEDTSSVLKIFEDTEAIADSTMWIDGVSLKEVLPGSGNLEIYGELNLKESGVAISKFSTDGAMADNSDTAVPTEKAVRAYVGVRETGIICHNNEVVCLNDEVVYL